MTAAKRNQYSSKIIITTSISVKVRKIIIIIVRTARRMVAVVAWVILLATTLAWSVMAVATDSAWGFLLTTNLA